MPRAGQLASTKRHNLLLPPGIHRFRQPGSGSELLDLRDYLPGDPPKTIAWKVSARRDRLITKEFESEVPVRCTLFVDTSSSVRVPALCGTLSERSCHGKALDRLIDIAAGVLHSNAGIRDLTGLCLFDEHGARTSPSGSRQRSPHASACDCWPRRPRTPPRPGARRSRSAAASGLQLCRARLPGAAASGRQCRTVGDDVAGRIFRLFAPPAPGPVRASASPQVYAANLVLVDILLGAAAAGIAAPGPPCFQDARGG